MEISGAGPTRQFFKFQAQKEATTDRAQGDEFGKGDGRSPWRAVQATVRPVTVIALECH